jgi:hypothetical protein
MADNREPIYAKDERYRVVSVHNGLWQAQSQVIEHGTRERDNWQNIKRPADLNTCKNTIIAQGTKFL